MPIQQSDSHKKIYQPGRPPDPGIEARVIDAALEIYAEVGWAGFTIDAVTRKSRVGKAAIYRRWPTRQELVAAAIRSLRVQASDELGINLRQDLLIVAQTYAHRYLGRHGLAYLRAQVEAKVYPDVLGEALEDIRADTISRGRSLVHRAIERGELPPDTSTALIMDAVAGSIVNRILLVPPGGLAELNERAPEFSERIVDFVLAAVGWKAVPKRRRPARA